MNIEVLRLICPSLWERLAPFEKQPVQQKGLSHLLMVCKEANFKEEEHPRSADGKFRDKAEGSGPKKKKPEHVDEGHEVSTEPKETELTEEEIKENKRKKAETKAKKQHRENMDAFIGTAAWLALMALSAFAAHRMDKQFEEEFARHAGRRGFKFDPNDFKFDFKFNFDKEWEEAFRGAGGRANSYSNFDTGPKFKGNSALYVKLEPIKDSAKLTIDQIKKGTYDSNPVPRDAMTVASVLRKFNDKLKVELKGKQKDVTDDIDKTCDELMALIKQNWAKHGVKEGQAAKGFMGLDLDLITKEMTKEEFKEEEHPRDSDGKFTDKPGAHIGTKPPEKGAHGGARANAGRLAKDPIMARESLIQKYRKENPEISEEETRTRLADDALRMNKPDLYLLVTNPTEYQKVKQREMFDAANSSYRKALYNKKPVKDVNWSDDTKAMLKETQGNKAAFDRAIKQGKSLQEAWQALREDGTVDNLNKNAARATMAIGSMTTLLALAILLRNRPKIPIGAVNTPGVWRTAFKNREEAEAFMKSGLGGTGHPLEVETPVWQMLRKVTTPKGALDLNHPDEIDAARVKGTLGTFQRWYGTWRKRVELEKQLKGLPEGEKAAAIERELRDIKSGKTEYAATMGASWKGMQDTFGIPTHKVVNFSKELRNLDFSKLKRTDFDLVTQRDIFKKLPGQDKKTFDWVNALVSRGYLPEHPDMPWPVKKTPSGGTVSLGTATIEPYHDPVTGKFVDWRIKDPDKFAEWAVKNDLAEVPLQSRLAAQDKKELAETALFKDIEPNKNSIPLLVRRHIEANELKVVTAQLDNMKGWAHFLTNELLGTIANKIVAGVAVASGMDVGSAYFFNIDHQKLIDWYEQHTKEREKHEAVAAEASVKLSKVEDAAEKLKLAQIKAETVKARAEEKASKRREQEAEAKDRLERTRAQIRKDLVDLNLRRFVEGSVPMWATQPDTFYQRLKDTGMLEDIGGIKKVRDVLFSEDQARINTFFNALKAAPLIHNKVWWEKEENEGKDWNKETGNSKEKRQEHSDQDTTFEHDYYEGMNREKGLSFLIMKAFEGVEETESPNPSLNLIMDQLGDEFVRQFTDISQMCKVVLRSGMPGDSNYQDINNMLNEIYGIMKDHYRQNQAIDTVEKSAENVMSSQNDASGGIFVGGKVCAKCGKTVSEETRKDCKRKDCPQSETFLSDIREKKE